MPSSVPLFLKLYTKSELQDSGIVGTGDLPEGSRRTYTVGIQTDAPKFRVIEDVECLGAKLHVHTLSVERGELGKCQRHVCALWATQQISRCGSIGRCGRSVIE